MAITLANADNALKSYYLDAVSEQLSGANPFLAKIKQSTDNVWGKEVKKLAIYGINGGFGGRRASPCKGQQLRAVHRYLKKPLRHYRNFRQGDKSFRKQRWSVRKPS